MGNKQTALQFFLTGLVDLEIGKNIPTDKVRQLHDLFNQAKQMEKQQKMECWETAHQAGRFEGKGIAEENWQTFEQYYNEEYGTRVD